MKNLIVYYSKYGHTKRYAEFLKTRIGGDMITIDELNKKVLKDYDNVIFGSSLRRNTILKLKNFLKLYKYMDGKNVFVFANGFSTMQVSDETKQFLIDMNGLYDYHIRFYLVPGGFSYADLKGIDKKMIDFSLKIGQKDAEQDLSLFKEREIDLVNPNALDRMVDVIHELERRN